MSEVHKRRIEELLEGELEHQERLRQERWHATHNAAMQGLIVALCTRTKNDDGELVSSIPFDDVVQAAALFADEVHGSQVKP